MSWKHLYHPAVWGGAIVIAAGVFAAFWYMSTSTVPLIQRAEQSPPAADFTLPSIDGPDVSLAGLRGKIVLINLWTPQCSACDAEVRALSLLQTGYKTSVVILGVALSTELSTEPGSDAAALKNAIAALKPAFPVLLGNQAFADSYPGSDFPRSFLVDHQGRLRATVLVAPDQPYKYFQRLVNALLADSS